MRLPKFEYLTPKTMEEALSLLNEHRGEARIFAGGSDIFVSMKQRVVTPKYLVNLNKIPDLDYIKNGENGLRIGPLTTLDTIEKSSVIKEKFPMLSHAAGEVGAPQLRNMGTIGGNISLDTRCWYYNQSHFWRKSRPVCYKLGGDSDNCQGFELWENFPSSKGNVCYSVYSGDTAPSLISLGASLKLKSSEGERTIALKDFFTGDGKKPFELESSEIITEIQVPDPPPYSGGAYLKLRLRGAIDFPLLGVATIVTLDSKDGICKEAQIVLGAVSSGPIKVAGAEDILKGKKIDDALMEEAGQIAYEEANPVPNIGSSPTYRKMMTKVFVKRALAAALKQIK